MTSKNNFDEFLLLMDDEILKSVFIKFGDLKGIRVSTYNKSEFSLGAFNFFIKYYFQAIKATVGIILKKIILFFSDYSSIYFIEKRTIGIYSFFPIFWKKLDEVYTQDIFFNSIPSLIQKNNPVLHLIWLSPFKSFFKSIADLNKFISTKNTYVLESGITFKEAFSILNYNIYLKLFVVFKSKNKIKIELENGLNISDIIYADLLNSLISPTFFQTLLIDIAMKKIDLSGIEKLLFRLEFQPFERAILYNTKNKVKTIGFQHSALSKNFLNYIFIKDELKGHWNNRSDSISMPLPDYIFTSGSTGFDYMVEAGYPIDQIFICGGIRYNELREKAPHMSSRKKLRIEKNISISDIIIFVASTPIIFETIGMLNSILQALIMLEDKKTQYQVIIKHHPNTQNMSKYINEIEKTMQSWEGVISYKAYWEGVDIHETIKVSNFVITTGGTIPLEAMILGVPTITYSINNQFSHNPLLEYPQSTLIVNDNESMYKALNKLNNSNASDLIKNEWSIPINMMFGEYSKNQNQKFVDLLNKIDQ